MENKANLIGYLQKKADGKYHILASTASVDRQGEVIDQNGWDLENFKSNPIALYGHDYGTETLPIGRYENIQVTASGLEMDLIFASAEASPLAGQIKALFDEGVLNAFSVGFMVLERNGQLITKAQLLEVSAVKVPANPQALMLMRSMKGLDDKIRTDIEKAADSAKGAVADQLSAEEMMEKKYAYMREIWEIMYAFCDVYCDAKTPVEDVGKLVSETAQLLMEWAKNPQTEEDEESAEKKFDLSKKQKFADFIVASFQASEKIGAQISDKNKKKIQQAIDHANECIDRSQKAVSVLGDVLNAQPASDDEGGKAIDGGDLPSDEETKVEQTQSMTEDEQKDVLFEVKKRLQISSKQTQKGLEAINIGLSKLFGSSGN